MATAVLIPDADVLITLAEHPENLGAINAIKRAIERGDPWREIVIAECVRDAYNREKASAAQAYWARQKAVIKGLRQLGAAVREPDGIKAIADELAAKVSALESAVPDTIAAVDELIAIGRIVPHTTEMWAEAARRFRADIPPAGARSQKSCITDCILWQMVVDESRRSPVTFCSNNKKDFSARDHGEKLHPDLHAELGAAKFCYHSLEGLREHHMRTVSVVVDPGFDAADRCYNCGAATESGLIPRPAQFGGGWSYQRFCAKCGRYSDTGEPYDE